MIQLLKSINLSVKVGERDSFACMLTSAVNRFATVRTTVQYHYIFVGY